MADSSSTSDSDEVADELHQKYSEVSRADLEKRLQTLLDTYQVAPADAKTVIGQNLSKLEKGVTKIGNIESERSRISIEAQAIEVNSASASKQAQTGRLADESGEIQFVVWEDSEITLDEGRKYTVTNATVNEYNDQLEIQISSWTNVDTNSD